MMLSSLNNLGYAVEWKLLTQVIMACLKEEDVYYSWLLQKFKAL